MSVVSLMTGEYCRLYGSLLEDYRSNTGLCRLERDLRNECLGRIGIGGVISIQIQGARRLVLTATVRGRDGRVGR